jgi:hypothetical protein
VQGIAACRFTLIAECSYSGENGAIDERTCLEWVLSFCPVGVIEGKQFDLPPQFAFSERLICGVQSMTALGFSRRPNKNIEGSQCHAADGEDAAMSVGSVN